MEQVATSGPAVLDGEDRLWSFDGPGAAQVWRQDEAGFIPVSLNGSAEAPLREYSPARAIGAGCPVCLAGVPGAFRYCPACGEAVSPTPHDLALPFDGWGGDPHGLPVLAADIALADRADMSNRPDIETVPMPKGAWVFVVAGDPLRAFAIDTASGNLCLEEAGPSWTVVARLGQVPLARRSFRAHAGRDAIVFPSNAGLARLPLPFAGPATIGRYGGGPAVGGVASLRLGGKTAPESPTAPIAAGDGDGVRLVSIDAGGGAVHGEVIAVPGPRRFGRPVRTGGGDWVWPGERGFLWATTGGDSGFTPWRAGGATPAQAYWELPSFVGQDGKAWQILRLPDGGHWVWERMDAGLAEPELREVGADWRVSTGYRAVRGENVFASPWAEEPVARCTIPHGPHGLPLAGLPGGGALLAGVAQGLENRRNLTRILTGDGASAEAWLALWPGQGPAQPLHVSLRLDSPSQIAAFVSMGALNLFDAGAGRILRLRLRGAA